MTCYSNALTPKIDKQKADETEKLNVAMFHNNRGQTYKELRRYTDAKDEFDEAIDLNEREQLYHFNRGSVFFLLGKYEDAHKDFNIAIEFEDMNPRFYHQKGLAYEAVGGEENVKLAIKNYQKALEIDDKWFASRFHLGGMYH